MEIRLTTHAAKRMREYGISRNQVERALDEVVATEIGGTAVAYDGTVDGRVLHMSVVRDSEPPLVITVWPVGED